MLLKPLYENNKAHDFLKNRLESEYENYQNRINEILSNRRSNFSFIKYYDYAITNSSTIYNYYMYISWLNKHKLQIDCMEILF